MKVLVKYITRKTNGGTAVREENFDSEVIAIGRATTCDVELPDSRVLLQHAQIFHRSDNLYVEVIAGETVSVNGHLVNARRLSERDELRIGPYIIIVEPPENEFEVTLSVEMMAPQDDELASLLTRSNIRADDMGVSKRQLSWIMFVVVLAAILIVPMVATRMSGSEHVDISAMDRETLVSAPTTLWNTGELSAAHRFFGNSCEVCHVQPFVPVQDGTCASCHPKISHHANPHMFAFASFGDTSCQNCHKEHQGAVSIVRDDQAFCADCHQDLSSHAAETTLLNATDFALDHPEFHPTVAKNVAAHVMDRKLSMSDNPLPSENSGLIFNHQDHVRAEGVEHPVNGNVQLECSNCHVSDDGSISMLPITFENHCHECHALRFDTHLPDREMAHDESAVVFNQISDVYEAMAMRGGYQEPEAPAILRRRPGTPLTPLEKEVAQNWAAAKVQEVMNGRFGRGLCAECHQVSDDPSSPIWNIEPVYIATQWFPKAIFTHKKHNAVDCVSCHAVKTSITSADVLMPAIETCLSCHGGEHADDRVPSTCVDCHRFHQSGLELMRPNITQIPPFEAAATGSAQ